MEQEGAAKRPHPNPLEGADSIAKLARKYDDRVRATRTAKGLKTEELDTDCEVTQIGARISEPAAVAKKDYKAAPTMTLNELVPSRFKQHGINPSTSKMNASFRSEKLEFVLMCRKLVATKQDDLEWDIPSIELYDEITTCLLYTSPSPRD